MITETADMFDKIVVPFIQGFPGSRLDWYVSSTEAISLQRNGQLWIGLNA